jgi:ABC-type multidrug transport system fused ATPase/permease subunit
VITTSSPLVLDRADEVVVLVDGKTSSVGTHAELLRTDSYYRELVSRGQDDR